MVNLYDSEHIAMTLLGIALVFAYCLGSDLFILHLDKRLSKEEKNYKKI